MTIEESNDEMEHSTRAIAPLSLILDIDGTLIAEGRHIHRIMLRPGVVEFLQQCKRRGYLLAIWTAASPAWAYGVATKLCKLVQNDKHECSLECKRTFEFVWTGERQRSRKVPAVYYSDADDHCRWCGPYKHDCRQCMCWQYAYACPCRHTKDLRKIWYAEDDSTKSFGTKHRTLIIENTPQKCIHNYGNAIYVPTFKFPEDEKDKHIFTKLGAYLETELESVSSVRAVQKCLHGSHPHACYEQLWW